MNETKVLREDTLNQMSIGKFFSKIYFWMALGVLFTGVVSFLTISTPLGIFVYGSKIVYYGIVALEVVLMFATQMLINKLPAGLSRALFFVYAGLNGITITGFLLQFSITSVFGIFLIAAAMFGVLAIYGYTTNKDLSGWGTFLTIGMIGVFVSSIVNMFLHNSVLNMIVSAVALLVFAGLTVYDNQLYKHIYEDSLGDEEAMEKATALGALHMYMNFIMIFVNLLSLFGNDD